jgi:hypothetical protein
MKHLAPRFVRPIVPSKQRASDIAILLRERGAPATCALLSADTDLNGRHMPLDEALRVVVGWCPGTFVSCVPGRLAYFEDEEGRCLLERAE